MLRANQLIADDLELEVVLRRIVQAAQELVDARYAAQGVIGPEGGLIEFVHTPASPRTPWRASVPLRRARARR